MSDIFKNVFGWIKGWRLDSFLKKLFANEEDEQTKEFAAWAVMVVQRAKDYSYNPVLNRAIDVIPGDWDNKIIDAAQKFLPNVLDKMVEGQACLDEDSFGGKLACFNNLVNSKPVEEKAELLNSFAVKIAVGFFEVFADGKVTVKEVLNKILILVPSLYLKIFKNN